MAPDSLDSWASVNKILDVDSDVRVGANGTSMSRQILIGQFFEPVVRMVIGQ